MQIPFVVQPIAVLGLEHTANVLGMIEFLWDTGVIREKPNDKAREWLKNKERLTASLEEQTLNRKLTIRAMGF